MVFLRAMLRGLIVLVIILSIAVWTMAATLQMTLLNRDTVKMWGEQSGAYDSLISTLDIREADATGMVDSAMLRDAISKTYTPSYIQEQAEMVIDATYDWTESKEEEIAFSIPIQERRDDFVTNLAALLQPKIENLPKCGSSLSLSDECMPQSYTAATYATSIAEQTANDSDLFEEPLTQASPETSLPVQNDAIPTYVGYITMASWLLPLVILLGAGAFIALSSERLKGMVIIGRRLVFSSLVLMLLGAIAWMFGGSLQLGAGVVDGSDPTLVTAVVQPLLREAIPSIGMWLAVFSGSVVLLGIVLWVIGYLLQRRADRSGPMGGDSVRDMLVQAPAPKPIAPPPAQPPQSRPPMPPKRPMNF
jgi:hypothetical protein